MLQNKRLAKKKSVTLLYTDDKLAETEIREPSLFKVTTSSMKYLEEILIKQVKHTYDKNCKSLQKEIEEEIRKWKHLPCS